MVEAQNCESGDSDNSRFEQKSTGLRPFCPKNKRFSLNPNPGLPQKLIFPGLKPSTASLCLHRWGKLVVSI